MRHLREKLNSQKGASLILALLFFLICAFVASTVLMAAVTNAGKYRSNQEEQQKQLALSSAVQLVCDDLAGAEYQGKFQYNNTTESGKQIQQKDGNFTAELSKFLLNDLDAIFAKQLESDQSKWGDEYTLEKKDTTNLPSSHTLTITPGTNTNLSDYPVTMKLEVTNSYAIYITAQLGTEENSPYKMYAEVTPMGTAPSLSTLPSDLELDEVRIAGDMTWKIGWISLHNDRDDT